MKGKSLSISLLLVVALFCCTVVSCSKDDEPPTSTTQTEPGPVEEPEPEEPEPTVEPDNTINGYEYVDMGLSVLWATRAVSASSPEELSVTRATGDIDYGDYFAWGEIEPKEDYSPENCTTYGIALDDITGDPRYDAATANWGSPWRIPTRDEFEELINNSECEYTTLDDIDGLLVTSKKNGNSIFIPAAGFYSGTILFSGAGHYWTSTNSFAEGRNTYACFFEFYPMGVLVDCVDRSLGYNVWPVAGPAPVITNDSGNANGYDYVDLGLSVKWATCNVGAISSLECGNYYAWGEIGPKEDYSPENSVTFGKEMEEITGDPNYDVATANWGSPWRMPTMEEFQELIDHCTVSAVVRYDVYGLDFISNRNGNSIFIPLAGYYDYTEFYDNHVGRYWSSMPLDGTSYAYYLSLVWHGTNSVDVTSRFYGYSVRPVCDR